MVARSALRVVLLLCVISLTACSNKDSGAIPAGGNPTAQSERSLGDLSDEIARLKSELAKQVAELAKSEATNANMAATFERLNTNRSEEEPEGSPEELSSLATRITRLEAKLRRKRLANNIVSSNLDLLSNEMKGHTNLYSLKGDYRVLVIPVEFSDKQFEDPDFVRNEAQEYLFGDHEGSLSNYYRHASLGHFKVSGEVADIVRVDGVLGDYGEAITGSSDKAARELVVQALTKLKESRTDEAWWESFDNWDLNDYDLDNNRHEPDGFMDAVVLIYAGKSQASCQASFDSDGSRPSSADVPPGPRHDAAVECFNRLWPHRWSISLGADDPRHSTQGPLLEGTQRPSMNGFKITDTVFALDYNMQSEFSDRSTFLHEFGHSLTLPDIYASQGGGNSTGAWELMSNNARLQAQELSSYSKLSLGWLEPKIVKKGQVTSAYVGAQNFVTNIQRDNNDLYTGPEKIVEQSDGQIHSYDVISLTPGFDEPVYRSIVALTGATAEMIQVVETPDNIERGRCLFGAI